MVGGIKEASSFTGRKRVGREREGEGKRGKEGKGEGRREDRTDKQTKVV